MSDRSKIGWTDATWPVVAGCDKVSPGCKHCYAIREARRMSGNPNPKIGDVYAGTVQRTAGGDLNWTGLVRPLPDRLDWPLRWKKPRKIFVCNQSDLFHEGVPFDFIAAVFGVMAAAPQHTFQVLTKRPERMRDWFSRWVPAFTDRQRGIVCAPNTPRAMLDAAYTAGGETPERKRRLDPAWRALEDGPWPLSNVWLGVSVEDQQRADERIPLLLETPAAVRFISAEPLLGPVDLVPFLDLCCEGCGEYDGRHADPTILCGPVSRMHGGRLSWVICGGESGPGARPCGVAWIRSLVEQCREAGVPVFVKQDSGLRSGAQGRIPDELWVQELPR